MCTLFILISGPLSGQWPFVRCVILSDFWCPSARRPSTRRLDVPFHSGSVQPGNKCVSIHQRSQLCVMLNCNFRLFGEMCRCKSLNKWRYHELIMWRCELFALLSAFSRYRYSWLSVPGVQYALNFVELCCQILCWIARHLFSQGKTEINLYR